MPLDSLTVRAIQQELEKETVGLKVDKVQQPERDRIVLQLRGLGKTCRLLLCTASGSARIALTEEAYENPASPPMLCMLLRKQLIGARIASVTQPGLERALDITLEAQDPLGYPCTRHLVFEAMGRYSNIILTDGENMIIECLHRIEGAFTDARMVLPGLMYRLPPPQAKENPLECSQNYVRQMVYASAESELSQVLLKHFAGFSPLICRELATRALGSSDAVICKGQEEAAAEKIWTTLSNLRTLVAEGNFVPCTVYGQDGKPLDYSYLDILQYGDLLQKKFYPTFSQMLESFYGRRDREERMRQHTQSLTKGIKTVYDRTVRRVALQKQELLKTHDRENLRRAGDLVTANMYRLSRGMPSFETEDFYQEDAPTVTVRLDPLKTPQQNAAKYYKDYNKSKTAEAVLTEQITQGENEVQYLDSVLEEIRRAETEKDIAEIRQELTDTGFLRRTGNSKKERRIEQKPMHFRSSTGRDIFVGKNNAQNDRLTLKDARKSDLWLHVQKIHGSHVLIPGEEPDEQTVFEAATLAATFSKGRDSGTVAVDYTPIRFVRKMPGGKPGMVIYTTYQTVFVHPDEELAQKLKIK